MKTLLTPVSRIIFISFSFKSVSRSRTISFLSRETTSPESSSTKSSTHVLSTLAASRLPSMADNVFLSALTSSAIPKSSRMSLSVSKPIERSKVVTGNFFFLSMYAYMTLLMSVANSIHAPLNGITLAEYILVPFGCKD